VIMQQINTSESDQPMASLRKAHYCTKPISCVVTALIIQQNRSLKA